MTDIVFLDTETLGLDPAAPVWEFAAQRRREGHIVIQHYFTIRHQAHPWAEQLAVQAPAFWDDYRCRYRAETAYDEDVAAGAIDGITSGAVVVGCNPGFDLERLTILLQRNGVTPSWHYHPIDIASLTQGYLAARGELPPPPYKSDALANALGVVTANYERHTALGDVLWTAAQYDRIMGTEASP